MANPYVPPPSLSGYNANAPSDDGQQTTSNQLEWQKLLDKVGDPLKTLLEAVDTNVNTAFATVDDAGNLTQGELADARLSANVPLLDGTPNNFTTSLQSGGVDVATLSTNWDAGDITTGTFADARVAESNVTQHQAALSLNQSQVTSDVVAGSGDVIVDSTMAGDVRIVNSASAQTITVGNDALGAIGKVAVFVRRGTGTLTFVASGTTLRTKASLAIALQHGAAALIQLSTTEYQLVGDL